MYRHTHICTYGSTRAQYVHTHMDITCMQYTYIYLYFHIHIYIYIDVCYICVYEKYNFLVLFSFFGLVFLQYMQAVALFLSDCGPGLSVYVCPFLSVSLIDRITNTLNN